jgi:uncharacterized membrane protein
LQKIRRPTVKSAHIDLVIIILLTLLLIPIVIYTEGAIRIIIGLPFVLFFPGYTLIAALFTKKDAIGGIERLALSFGLSIAVVPLIGLVLNYVWEISLYSVLISITAFIFIMCATTWFRRRQIPPAQRYELNITFKKIEWEGRSRLDRSLSVVLALAIVAAIGTLIYVVAAPKVGEKFTEFYILNTDGVAADYPADLSVGEEAELILGIINHEQEPAIYYVKIAIDAEQVQQTESIALANNESWEEAVSFSPTKTGDEQKVEFLLYKNNESEWYLSTHLWINVSAP